MNGLFSIVYHMVLVGILEVVFPRNIQPVRFTFAVHSFIFVGRSFGVVPVRLSNGFVPSHRVWVGIYRSGDFVV